MQDNTYKDKLLVVDQNLIGPKDRGALTSNAVVAGNAVNFHPMVRDNWGTSDTLRGALGSYYTKYLSTKGETLYNYAAALDVLRNGGQVGASDQEQNGIGPLRFQLVGNNDGTNIIFERLTFHPNGSEIEMDISAVGWNSYPVVAGSNGNTSAWLLDNINAYVGNFTNESAFFTDIDSGNIYSYRGLLQRVNEVSGAQDLVFERKTLLDHTSNHFLLSGNRALREKSGVLTDVTSEYSFYVNSNPDYEDVIADPRVKEYLIPNSYYLQLELRNTSSVPLQSYHVMAVQFGADSATPIVRAQTAEGPVDWFSLSYPNATENNVGVYYNLYSDGMAAAISTIEDREETIKKYNSDLAVLHSDLGVLEPESINTQMIPFYNTIKLDQDEADAPEVLQTLFSNPDTADAIDILQAVSIFGYYVRMFLPGVNLATRVKTLQDAENLNDYTFSSAAGKYPIVFDFKDILVNGLSGGFTDFIKSFQNSPQSLFQTLPLRFLRDYFGKSSDELNADPADVAMAMTNAALEYFPNGVPNIQLQKLMRSLEEIFANSTSHTETLLYIVEKYRVEGSTDELVQRFFFSPRFGDSYPSAANSVYYDSQIKYNVKYRYDFKKVVLIFGNEYTYPDRTGISTSEYVPYVPPPPLIDPEIAATAQYAPTVSCLNQQQVNQIYSFGGTVDPDITDVCDGTVVPTTPATQANGTAGNPLGAPISTAQYAPVAVNPRALANNQILQNAQYAPVAVPRFGGGGGGGPVNAASAQFEPVKQSRFQVGNNNAQFQPLPQPAPVNSSNAQFQDLINPNEPVGGNLAQTTPPVVDLPDPVAPPSSPSTPAQTATAVSETITISGISNIPSIKAVIVPYSVAGIETVVIDKPPVSPNISFYPIKGDDSRIKILLNSNTGEYQDKPVRILDTDTAFYQQEYFAQTGVTKTFEDMLADGDKIQFRSDDLINKYQLFRLPGAPTSYRDFNGTLIEVDPDIGIPGYFEDEILPNRKYYYCARSVDVHDNISNPTYIFEIEMVNNNGQIFLRQEIFRFPQIKPTYSKDGRRFIYVEPSFRQVAFEQEVPIPANINVSPPDNILGADTTQQKCWDKTFKVRVTSKKTGKKMDLNLTFKNSGVTNPS